MWLAGFDPGGKGQFGWCLVEATAKLPLAVRNAGVESHAAAAVDCALSATRTTSAIDAAGIDSPLFWSCTGDRNADLVIRRQIRQLGATAASGTVQHINSLRGACLAQGILTAHLLRREAPQIRITESHPKALLWLMEAATASRPPVSVAMNNLSAFLQCETEGLSEHERDAALGALGAWAMITRPRGWRDLLLDEDAPFVPISPVEYWMPTI